MKLMKLLCNEFLDVLTIVGIVFVGMIVKYMRTWVIFMLEDADVLDAGEVLFVDDCNHLSEGNVVTGHISLEGVSVVKNARSCHSATLHIIKHTDGKVTQQNIIRNYIFMQQTQAQRSPFAPFRIRATDLSLLHAIPQTNQELKTSALIDGCLMRKKLGLYKGSLAFYDDLQIVLDHDRENGPNLLKNAKISVSKDGTTVMPQCFDCGKYNPPFNFCGKCENIHYCSEGCEMRSKLTHQDECRPRVLPCIDSPLQLQIHLGSDLGHNIEVYFQHEMRMSLQMRGEKIIKSIFDFFNTDGRSFIPQNFAVDIFNKHFRYRKVDQSKYLTTNNGFAADTFQKLIKLYQNNHFLSHLEVFLFRRGAILCKQIKQVHNNHFHLVYIFLCCE